MTQVERGTSATISVSFFDGEDVAPVVSATIGIVSSSGAVVVDPGTATTAGSECFTYLLGPPPECDRLTATWTGLDADSNVWSTTTVIEVVGAFYFGLRALRMMPEIVDSGDRYSSEDLADGRRFAESLIERRCGTSFVERFHEELQPAPEGLAVDIWVDDPYPVRLLGISLDGTPVADVDLPNLTFHRDKILPTQNHVWPTPFGLAWTAATVRYVAAYSTEPDSDLRSAGLVVARDYVTTVHGNSEVSTASLESLVSSATLDLIEGWRDKVRLVGVA